MSLSHAMHIDQTFDADDTPVTTRYGIQTGNGVLRLAGASFFGKLPNNEMPPEITVERAGGTLDAKDRYVHYSRIEQVMNERMEGSRYRIHALEIEVRELAEDLDKAERCAMVADELLAYCQHELKRLRRPVCIRMIDRIRAIFGAKP